MKLKDLDLFTLAYIETALWASTDESDPETGGEPMDDNYGPEDLTSDALEFIARDCLQFQEENAGMIDRALEEHGQDEERCAHDFWLTRCHTGAGYWDGDYGDGEVSKALDKAAKAFGECSLFVSDDGKIYIM